MALNISDLEFETIKNNIKDYLRSQTEFNDFDFEGSAFNILIDTISYATHYMGFYANMSLSEMFLETAQLRSSIVSRAKELNYFPRQVTAPSATIKLEITPDGTPTSIKVPAGTIFSTNDKTDVSVSFITTQDEYLSDPLSIGTYSGTFDIVEGVLVKEQYVYDGTNFEKIYTLSNDNVDTTTLKISADGIAWTQESDLTLLKKNSKVYFLSEEDSGRVAFYFGDGIVAGKPTSSTLIDVSYVISKGTSGNGIKTFNVKNPISSYAVNDFTLTVVDIASGGAERESNESIRLIAPKHYKIQGRAITAEDYKTILLNKYGNIDAIATWGGQDNIPVSYGKVFISIKPKVGKVLTNGDKDKILNQIIKPYNVVTITPVIVDAEYLYVNIINNVIYDPTQTIQSAGNITSLISDTVNNYFNASLNKFNSTLRNSNLLKALDDTDSSIVSNSIKYEIAREIHGSTIPTNYFFSFNNTLVENSVRSESWTVSDITYQIKSGTAYNGITKDANGTNIDVRMADLEILVNGVKSIKRVGTIIFDTGAVSMSGFNAKSVQFIKLYGTPLLTDIDVARNTIITLNTLTVNIDEK